MEDLTVRKQTIVGAIGFGVLMVFTFFLIGLPLIIAIPAGLGACFLFGIIMLVLANAQASKMRNLGRADERANRDIMLQLSIGSAITIISMVFAIGGDESELAQWAFVCILGFANVLTAFGRARERYGRRKLGEILLAKGIITEEELIRALEEQQQKPVSDKKT
jgi:peptidoglycan/LPS O-acetylase OafA/YrhL